jgi:hypothetical protein
MSASALSVLYKLIMRRQFFVLDNHLFSDAVFADIVLDICLLVAKKLHLPTITFEAMPGKSTVAVPHLKPELPSRGRKRGRKN